MRRKYLGLAIAAIAAFGPMQAQGGDREIAEQIIQRLQTNRDSGALKNFTLDMKVDQGVVLFRGNVNGKDQKDLVLNAARGIDGISNVRDELTVTAVKPADVKPAEAAEPQQAFSLREALAEEARLIMAEEIASNPVATEQVAELQPFAVEPIAAVPAAAQPIAELATGELPASDASEVSTLAVVPGEIRPAAATELAAAPSSSDQKIVSSVVSALGKAQKAGALKGFGVDVKSNDGVVWLKGRASSAAQRNRILQIAESTPGVNRVRNSIQIPAQVQPQAKPALPAPPAIAKVNTPVARPASNRLAPVSVQPVPQPVRATNRVPAAMAAAPMNVQTMQAPYRVAPHMANQPLRTQPVQATMGAPTMGAPAMGQPVPVGGYTGGVGAPRYDSPNLPNYAWPGYAAHPNYAALTYPQQYSPSAWPYIGPFYPYPQVPMGWRKVSLEWDDGWWFLDFTDR
ncbi:MAG: BON domain-containing protein [Pirellulaceae bacterium]|nr:BON domain-containing protein [Pirellulaceae bacterium]